MGLLKEQVGCDGLGPALERVLQHSLEAPPGCEQRPWGPLVSGQNVWGKLCALCRADVGAMERVLHDAVFGVERSAVYLFKTISSSIVRFFAPDNVRAHVRRAVLNLHHLHTPEKGG